jgi:hypothetical protein
MSRRFSLVLGTATALAVAVTAAAIADGRSAAAQPETVTDRAWAQIAQAPEDCVVPRLRSAWEATGKPEVKGWADDVTNDEAAAAYACIQPNLAERFAGSDEPGAKEHPDWPKVNTVPYESTTHGGRFVNNIFGPTADAYAKFEDAGTMPEGAVLVKDSFGIDKTGAVKAGPLFTMVKMAAGWREETGDWRYALVFPNGNLMGATGGQNSDGVKFCADCHMAVASQDSLFFLPDEFRVQ